MMFNRRQTHEGAAVAPDALVVAVRKILRPLVYLLLKFRIIFPQLAEILKKVYVEVADEKFRLPGKVQTDSRLSLLTGIHRKDIKRLRPNAVTDTTTPFKVDIGTRIVSRWISDPSYQNKEGKPIDLPLKSKNDHELSFEKLVYDICKQDIRPRVVLDDWLNSGIASLHQDKVKLNSQAFIAKHGIEEKAFFLGHNISDHLSSATTNLLSGQPPFFERCIYYDGLSEASIKQLEEKVESKGMEAILEINALANRLKEQDSKNPGLQNKTENSHRINIGLYVYHETEESK